jgi:hypothetical protein
MRQDRLQEPLLEEWEAEMEWEREWKDMLLQLRRLNRGNWERWVERNGWGPYDELTTLFEPSRYT